MSGKARSPNYPAVPLSQAEEAARKLWLAEKRTTVSNETAAADMGYKNLTGPARVMIGALRQYGLIERAELGHFRLSELAVNLLHGTDAQRHEARIQTAFNPPLFSELSHSHADASEAAIRSYLLTKKGFVEDGAKKAARAFREAMDLAGGAVAGYNPPQESKVIEATADPTIGRSDAEASHGGSIAGALDLSIPFAKGTIRVQVKVTGDAIRPSHLARVRKYLAMAEEDWNVGNDEMGVPHAPSASEKQ